MLSTQIVLDGDLTISLSSKRANEFLAPARNIDTSFSQFDQQPLRTISSTASNLKIPALISIFFLLRTQSAEGASNLLLPFAVIDPSFFLYLIPVLISFGLPIAFKQILERAESEKDDSLPLFISGLSCGTIASLLLPTALTPLPILVMLSLVNLIASITSVNRDKIISFFHNMKERNKVKKIISLIKLDEKFQTIELIKKLNEVDLTTEEVGAIIKTTATILSKKTIPKDKVGPIKESLLAFVEARQGVFEPKDPSFIFDLMDPNVLTHFGPTIQPIIEDALWKNPFILEEMISALETYQSLLTAKSALTSILKYCKHFPFSDKLKRVLFYIQATFEKDEEFREMRLKFLELAKNNIVDLGPSILGGIYSPILLDKHPEISISIIQEMAKKNPKKTSRRLVQIAENFELPPLWKKLLEVRNNIEIKTHQRDDLFLESEKKETLIELFNRLRDEEADATEESEIVASITSNGADEPIEKTQITEQAEEDLLPSATLRTTTSSNTFHVTGPIKIEDVQLGNEIKRGAMGVVYEGTFEGRPVAVKVAHQPGEMSNRTREEAKTYETLKHPNIITTEKSGTLLDGRAYFVMPRIKETLRDRLKQDNLTTNEILQIFKQISDGLEHAHEKGYIHRDIKPENILLDEEGQVYLADFGVAKDIGPELEAMTRQGRVHGTIPYIAPEQLEAEPVKKSDTYSVGVMLMEFLFNDRPTKELYNLVKSSKEKTRIAKNAKILLASIKDGMTPEEIFKLIIENKGIKIKKRRENPTTEDVELLKLALNILTTGEAQGESKEEIEEEIEERPTPLELKEKLNNIAARVDLRSTPTEVSTTTITNNKSVIPIETRIKVVQFFGHQKETEIAPLTQEAWSEGNRTVNEITDWIKANYDLEQPETETRSENNTRFQESQRQKEQKKKNKRRLKLEPGAIGEGLPLLFLINKGIVLGQFKNIPEDDIQTVEKLLDSAELRLKREATRHTGEQKEVLLFVLSNLDLLKENIDYFLAALTILSKEDYLLGFKGRRLGIAVDFVHFILELESIIDKDGNIIKAALIQEERILLAIEYLFHELHGEEEISHYKLYNNIQHDLLRDLFGEENHFKHVARMFIDQNVPQKKDQATTTTTLPSNIYFQTDLVGSSL